MTAIAVISTSVPALGQEPPEVSEGPADSSGRVIYDGAYFAAYEVLNAQDMLRRIPGVNAILAAAGRGPQQRGFGSGGDQVLLNGRRFPGKSNDISRTLSRLRAESVERVELIRGGGADIDVQSTGVIVNIVLKEGASLAVGGTFEASTRGNDEGAVGFDGLATYAGSTGSLGYNVGVERALWTGGGVGVGGAWTNRFRDEIYLYPDGLVQELRPQFYDRDYLKWVFTGGMSYDLAGGARAQINGLYETARTTEFSRINLTRFDRQGIEIDRANEEQTRKNSPATTLELGAEMAASLWGGDVTVLLLGNSRDHPTLDDRIRIRGSEIREISRSDTDLRRTEYIGRVRYSLPVWNKLILSLGGEGARNKLRQNLSPFFDLDKDGEVELIAIPTADARVEEMRGEVFAETKWSPSAVLSATGSLNYEHSKLTTNSIFNPGRTLGFLKPRLDVRYTSSSAGVLRVLVERLVSQLDFINFVPSYNVLDDRIDAGNPGLLPEKTWSFELGYEHRLPNDLGVLGGTVFYNDIADAIDAVPLQQGLVLVSAEGNLGSARRYGAKGEASLRLAPIGLRNAVLSVTGEVEKSSVIDPFTRERRRIRNDSVYEFTVGYRHDISALNLSYGFDYRDRGRSRIQSDLFSRDLFRIGDTLSAFSEKRVTNNLVLRAEAQNLLKSGDYRRRKIFLVNQMDGVIRRLDSYRETRDLRYALILKGTF